MSDTVFESNEVGFTRFWGGMKGDCVQVTLHGKACDKAYAQMTLSEFREAYKAIEASVEETKDAFWHHIGKV